MNPSRSSSLNSPIMPKSGSERITEYKKKECTPQILSYFHFLRCTTFDKSNATITDAFPVWPFLVHYQSFTLSIQSLLRPYYRISKALFAQSFHFSIKDQVKFSISVGLYLTIWIIWRIKERIKNYSLSLYWLSIALEEFWGRGLERCAKKY